TGVDEPELPPRPLRSREMPVTRGVRFLADDRRVGADDPVEERRLADIRAPDDGHDGTAHRARTTTGSVSFAPITSMKSYDGSTVTGTVARMESSGASSRKSPLSLMVSAGMSARSRSLRP